MSNHKRSCPTYGNYQPPYEECDCGAEQGTEAPATASEGSATLTDAALEQIAVWKANADGYSAISYEEAIATLTRLLRDAGLVEVDVCGTLRPRTGTRGPQT